MSVRKENGVWWGYCDKCAWQSFWSYGFRVQAAEEFLWHKTQPYHKQRTKPNVRSV